MTGIAFVSAVLALLLAPGPTNTLIGLAGAQGPVRRAAHLIPAELLGYLSSIVPLALLGREALARWPLAAGALKLAAAAWILVLAVRLWRRRDAGTAQGGVTVMRVYVTTLLNPKGLIVALVLLPLADQPLFVPRLAIFCAAVALVAGLWFTLGRAARSGGSEQRMLMIRRAASAWLAVVSVTLAARTLAG